MVVNNYFFIQNTSLHLLIGRFYNLMLFLLLLFLVNFLVLLYSPLLMLSTIFNVDTIVVIAMWNYHIPLPLKRPDWCSYVPKKKEGWRTVTGVSKLIHKLNYMPIFFIGLAILTEAYVVVITFWLILNLSWWRNTQCRSA